MRGHRSIKKLFECLFVRDIINKIDIAKDLNEVFYYPQILKTKKQRIEDKKMTKGIIKNSALEKNLRKTSIHKHKSKNSTTDEEMLKKKKKDRKTQIFKNRHYLKREKGSKNIFNALFSFCLTDSFVLAPLFRVILVVFVFLSYL